MGVDPQALERRAVLPVTGIPAPSPGLLVWLAAILVAVPWFWPILAGPVSAMWPDLLAWAVGAVLLSLLPAVRPHWGLALATGWLGAAAGSAILALLQYFNLEDGLYPFVSVTAPGIAYANVHQPNMLATLLGVGLLAAYWLVDNRRLSAVLAVWLGVLILLGLAATGSRTGTVHLMLLAALLFYWRGFSVRRVAGVVAAWAFYLAAAVTLPWLLALLFEMESGRVLMGRMAVESTCSSRIVLWSNVLHLISLKPWTGWGADGLLYAHYITPYEGVRFCDKLSNAHNVFLQLAVEYGLPVAVVVLAVSFWALLRLRPWRAVSSDERLGWAILLLIGFHSMVEFPLWFGVFHLMTALAIALIWSGRYWALTSEASQKNARPSRPVRQWLLTVIGLSVLAYVAYDYHRVSQLYLPLEYRAKRYEANAFDHARKTELFKSHVLIAQVVATPIDARNAELLLVAAQEALHIAPDSRVIRRVIEAARLVGKDEIAQLHEARYRAAWPELYEQWMQQRDRAQMPTVTEEGK